jgi:UDP-N-acetylglucosamine 4,6-dehydratase
MYDSSSYKILNNSTILITGGTGSFGNAFTKKILGECKPKKLIIFSRDEQKQYDMAQKFSHEEYPCIRYFIGDVRDADRLEMAMRDVDYVIHAAALKHVTAAEYNPFECIHTNVLGAENIVKASIRTNVKKVIALSTDKATNPVNLYGASKLASDKIFIAANHLSGQSNSKFSVVRYGNVLGSRGSVVPYFISLIKKNAKALPITDTKMTRFWITLNDSVDFVTSSLAMMIGGELFIPKIPSMKIVDLAKTLAPNLPHEIIGVRPGEKIHELMITTDDAKNTLELNDRYIVQPSLSFWADNCDVYKNVKKVSSNFIYSSETNKSWLDESSLKIILKEFEIEFQK